MSNGLTWFICLAPIVLFVGYLFTCFLNFRHNIIWRKYQLDLLEVGEYRWLMGSPKKGIGHRVAVVKEITKKRIIFDEWGQTEDGWKQLAENVDYSIADFFHFTNGEPCYWVGCSEDLSKE